MMTLIIPRKEAPVSGEGTVVIPQPAGGRLFLMERMETENIGLTFII